MWKERRVVLQQHVHCGSTGQIPCECFRPRWKSTGAVEQFQGGLVGCGIPDDLS